MPVCMPRKFQSIKLLQRYCQSSVYKENRRLCL
uniref:Uncharacterized protein n=1 Tax=Rhizophora mucronata TaxID=61149 RepID=A0A2P2PSQ7_RHIMU